MKTVFLILLLSLSTSAHAGFNFDTEPTGFRDMKWADSSSKLGESAFVAEESGHIKFMVRGSEKNSIGDVKVTRIAYGFYRDRFNVVIIQTSGRENCKGLLAAFRANFGSSGFKANQYIEQFVWGNTRIGAMYSYSKVRNRVLHQCSGTITNNAVSKEQKLQDSKNAAKLAAGDM